LAGSAGSAGSAVVTVLVTVLVTAGAAVGLSVHVLQVLGQFVALHAPLQAVPNGRLGSQSRDEHTDEPDWPGQHEAM